MKNLTLEEFKKIHEEWKSTGLSIRDYCHNTGFEESKFYYWRKKLTEAMLPHASGFVPVNMFDKTASWACLSPAPLKKQRIMYPVKWSIPMVSSCASRVNCLWKRSVR